MPFKKSISLTDEYLVKQVEALAEAQNRKFANCLQTLLKSEVKKQIGRYPTIPEYLRNGAGNHE